MPEKMNQSPAEMLNQNAAVAQNAEVPAPAAPVTPARQSYAEKVQGLTIDERNWMLAKSKAAAMAPSSTTAASLQAAPATAWRARRAPKPGGAV